MTDTTATLQNTVQRCRERSLVIPTFAQLRHPETIPQELQELVAKTPMEAVHLANLFRITWKNDPETGGHYRVNYLEMPPGLTGVPVPIV
nr:pyridoxal-5-phosphate-dependent protein subunit beta [bacterium]